MKNVFIQFIPYALLSKLKLNRKMIIACGIIITSGMEIAAQNASFDQNAIPINGVNCSAFGFGALFNNNPGTASNTATGFNSLFNNVFGQQNVANGNEALFNNVKGHDNTAVGYRSMFNNIDGDRNAAVGFQSLFSNTFNDENTAHGYQALYSNQTSGSTATGYQAMFANTTGGSNTANGYQGMFNNTTGSENTAIGVHSLFTNTTGYRNVSVGNRALFANTTGTENTAMGWWALQFNTTGIDNTAVGIVSLTNNTTGWYNAAVGYGSLLTNNTGIFNTAMGTVSLWSNTTGSYNAACGTGALFNNVTGDCNSALGRAADVNAPNLNNATAIGCGALVNAANKVRFGDAAVTVVEGPVAYTISDGRFKSNIREEDVKGLDFINKLRPVVYNFEGRKFEEFLTKDMPDSIRTFYMSKDFKPATVIRQSGFIAQEVEKAAKEAGYDFNGVHTPESAKDNYSLAYGQFVVPLVKGMQEQQQMIEKQENTIKLLQKQLDEIKALMIASQGKENISGSNNRIDLADKNTIVLNQNVPNPFAESTVISYNIPTAFNNAQILFSNVDGTMIKTFDIKEKGNGTLNVFANDLTSGLYKYALIVDGKTIDTKSLVKK